VASQGVRNTAGRPLPERNLGAPDKCEYLVRIDWDKTHSGEDAWWEAGLFANQNTAAKLRDMHTIARLEQHFGLDPGDE